MLKILNAPSVPRETFQASLAAATLVPRIDDPPQYADDLQSYTHSCAEQIVKSQAAGKALASFKMLRMLSTASVVSSFRTTFRNLDRSEPWLPALNGALAAMGEKSMQTTTASQYLKAWELYEQFPGFVRMQDVAPSLFYVYAGRVLTKLRENLMSAETQAWQAKWS